MFKKNLIAAAIAMGLGIAAGSASADTFSFDPTGGGSTAINNAAIIDEAPGNSLATGVGGGFGSVVGTQFTLLYQANLSNIQADDNSILFSNGTAGNFFTIVGAFPEVVVASSPTSAQFGLGNTGPNAFNIYATNALGNNLTGNGFAAGSQILSAHVVSSNGSFAFSTTSAGGCHAGPGGVQVGNLDQSPNGNQWGAQQTACGSGAADLTLVIDSVNAGYFPDLLAGSSFVLHVSNASLVDPFKQVDPSRNFSSNGVNNADRATNLGGAGSINGLSCGTATAPPCDFIFQSDANGSFTRVTVPEPASLALLGIGLAAMGGLRRRRKQ